MFNGIVEAGMELCNLRCRGGKELEISASADPDLLDVDSPGVYMRGANSGTVMRQTSTVIRQHT